MSVLPYSTEVVCRAEHVSGPARVQTTVLRGEKYGFFKARECVFRVEGRFYAETVMVYPSVGVNLPIFGSEYLEIGKKYFAAVDFHPASGGELPDHPALEQFPVRSVEFSRHYDLLRYFSSRLWLKRSTEPLYDEFKAEFEARIEAYYSLLNDNLGVPGPPPSAYGEFNRYMADHDPAHGILKAYFGGEFADDYLRRVLFSEEMCC